MRDSKEYSKMADIAYRLYIKFVNDITYTEFENEVLNKELNKRIVFMK